MTSVESFLLNSDIKNFNVKIYLDENLYNNHTEEVSLLKKWNLEVISVPIEDFPSKQQVIYRPENTSFNKFICIDTDAYAYAINCPLVFGEVSKIDSPLAAKFQIGDITEGSLLDRKFQSKVYKDKNDQYYLNGFRSFLQKMKVASPPFFTRDVWNWGWFSFYNKSFLDKCSIWHKCYDFVVNRIKTTCDETLFMLYEYLKPNSIYDFDKSSLKLEGGINLTTMNNTIIHPIWGNDCKKIHANRMIIDLARRINPIKIEINGFESLRHVFQKEPQFITKNNIDYMSEFEICIGKNWDEHKLDIYKHILKNNYYSIIFTNDEKWISIKATPHETKPSLVVG